MSVPVPTIVPLSEEVHPRPFWSVMIPVYDPPEGYLREMLESVLRQDPGPERMQIEVVDDCSPNVDVVATVRRIAGKRVGVFRSPANRGLAGCWNACIERSRGRWLHLLHQDDRVADGFYREMERLISEQPDAGAAFCRNDYVDQDGRGIGSESPLQPQAGLLEGGVATLAFKNQVQCPAIVVNRSAYEAVGGFDGGFPFIVDWEMWLRVGSRFPVLYSPAVLASFRMQTGSETSRLARTGETVRDAARLIRLFPKYVPAERVAAAQQAARDWTTELAMVRVEKFLSTGHALWAMAQLHAVLGMDRRGHVWKHAIRLWLRTVLRARILVPPPLPFLPQSLFTKKTA